MGAWGGIIMGFFGAMFATLTMVLQLGSTGMVLSVPAVAFGAIALAAAIVIRLPGEGISPSPRAKRVILWSTLGEGAGLFIASNVVVNLGHPDLLLPAIALVVGLHFLPMAYGIPFRPYYAVGVSLLAAAMVGFVLSQPVGGACAGFAAAAALWGASLLAIYRDITFKAAANRAG